MAASLTTEDNLLTGSWLQASCKLEPVCLGKLINEGAYIHFFSTNIHWVPNLCKSDDKTPIIKMKKWFYSLINYLGKWTCLLWRHTSFELDFVEERRWLKQKKQLVRPTVTLPWRFEDSWMAERDGRGGADLSPSWRGSRDRRRRRR